MNKNIKLLLGASSVAMLSICALQGCSSDSTGTTTPGAGATGTAGAHTGGATGTAGAPAGGATGTAGGTSTAGAPAGGAATAGAGGAATAGAGGAAAGAGGAAAGAGGASGGAGGAAAGAAGGEGTPSADCVMFCSDEMTTCTFGATDAAPYTGTPACLAACASFTAGTVGMTSGDTFGCRRYHLTAAASGADDATKAANKKTHCPHTGKPSVAMYGDATATGPCK